MTTAAASTVELRAENAELRAQLEEAEETLQAIRRGDVDAMVMGGQIYSLEGAETPYRIMLESMSEGAAMLLADGTVIYANRRLAEMLQTSLQSLLGSPLHRFVSESDRPAFGALLGRAQQGPTQVDLNLRRGDSPMIPVQLSCSVPTSGHNGVLCITATDLTARKHADAALRTHAEELTLFNVAAVDRELRMIELKTEVNELTRQLGQPLPYNLEGLLEGQEPRT